MGGLHTKWNSSVGGSPSHYVCTLPGPRFTNSHEAKLHHSANQGESQNLLKGEAASASNEHKADKSVPPISESPLSHNFCAKLSLRDEQDHVLQHEKSHAEAEQRPLFHQRQFSVCSGTTN